MDVDGSTPEICSILSLLLDHKVDPNIQSTERGFAPLHHAADTRNLDVVKILLEWDLNLINATDKVGKTSLWYACLHSSPNMDMIKYLARKGALFVDDQWPQVSGSRGEMINSILEKNMTRSNGR